MKNDERMDELVHRALREVDVPPPAPREAMWTRIEAQRMAQRESRSRGRGPLRLFGSASGATRVSRMTWLASGAAIAATLVIGIGVGRMTFNTGTSTPDVRDVAVMDEPAVPTAYRLAAAQHMQRTETLLSSLAMPDQGGTAELSMWARDLLTDTRLLMGSPAADDAATHRLLEDLELLLAQIAGIPAARATEEVELIQNGINQSDVLLRLHAATATRVRAGT